MEVEKTVETPLPKGLGSSVRVRNVQALSADPNELTAEVLERYIRPEMDDDIVVSGDNSEVVPVIDMARLIDEKFMEEEAAKLKVACEEWGFFQFVNHGISEKVMEEMKANIKGFFELPLEERETVAQKSGELEGYGQAFVFSEEQKLDWADMMYISTQPPRFRNFKIWPAQPPSFRESLESYSNELQKVAHCILGFMAKNLGVNPEKLTHFYGSQSVRINYYPPCRDAHDKILGLTPHSDAGGLTLLLQTSSVAGLQIRKNDVWLPVNPLPGAFVVNIGDSLEVLTNGKYKSIEHRAVINADKERMSIAAFHSPNFGETIGPLAEIVGDGKPLYMTLSLQDFAKLFLTKTYSGKNMTEHMKLNA
ncbi:hypothetical protein LUZ60_016931 [Juncus effusus]|nr:hypothetical protein LUZ60_016931 [Juncus effusus]